MLGGVLFISPSSADGALIRESLGCACIPARHVGSLQEARQLLEREIFGAVLTEATLPDGDWKDVIALVRSTGREAAVVVADRLANAELWADVLELGGYDLIATPYCPQEVQRIIAIAVRETPRPVRIPPVSEQRSPRQSISVAAF